MEALSSHQLVLSRKRRREGSNGETEEGERLGKIPRCTVVSSTLLLKHVLTCVLNLAKVSCGFLNGLQRQGSIANSFRLQSFIVEKYSMYSFDH